MKRDMKIEKKKKGSTPVNDVQLCQLKANLAEA